MNLTETYRPKSISEVLGQGFITCQLQEFVAAPHSQAFIFAGETGTGKTSLALAVARELGAWDDVCPEMAGLSQIASGSQNAESVRSLMDNLRLTPLMGSGWKVAVINEADYMSTAAANIWLDALENLPPRTVVIFTTNAPEKIAPRLRDRCESFAFVADADAVTQDAQSLINHVWAAEKAAGPAPRVADLENVVDEAGNLSFRRVLQRLAPRIRYPHFYATKGAAQTVAPAAASAPAAPVAFDVQEMGRRWKAGEKIAKLAKEVGMTWQKLHGMVVAAGFARANAA